MARLLTTRERGERMKESEANVTTQVNVTTEVPQQLDERGLVVIPTTQEAAAEPLTPDGSPWVGARCRCGGKHQEKPHKTRIVQRFTIGFDKRHATAPARARPGEFLTAPRQAMNPSIGSALGVSWGVTHQYPCGSRQGVTDARFRRGSLYPVWGPTGRMSQDEQRAVRVGSELDLALVPQTPEEMDMWRRYGTPDHDEPTKRGAGLPGMPVSAYAVIYRRPARRTGWGQDGKGGLVEAIPESWGAYDDDETTYPLWAVRLVRRTEQTVGVPLGAVTVANVKKALRLLTTTGLDADALSAFRATVNDYWGDMSPADFRRLASEAERATIYARGGNLSPSKPPKAIQRPGRDMRPKAWRAALRVAGGNKVMTPEGKLVARATWDKRCARATLADLARARPDLSAWVAATRRLLKTSPSRAVAEVRRFIGAVRVKS